MNELPNDPNQQEPSTPSEVQDISDCNDVPEVQDIPTVQEMTTANDAPNPNTTQPAMPQEQPAYPYQPQPPYPYPPQTSDAATATAKPAAGGVSIGAKILLVLMFLAVVGFCVFCIVWDLKKGSQSGGYLAGDITEVYIGQQSKPDTDPNYTTADGRYTSEGIAAVVMPSIVQIYTYESGVIVSTGSGIVLTKDGYIATNAHVVKSGDSFSIIMNDETIYDAVCVGYDTKTDIAVMKVEANDLQPAAIGNSDETVLGEEVYALGCPAGFSGSISRGIISGMHRKVRAESNTYEMDCLQTDAAISSGNSGGALVNLYGQVIGITSSKYIGSIFDSGSYEGLGFAITINEALPILQDIIQNGFVSGRVRVGIQFYEASSVETATGLKLPKELQGVGVFVTAVDEDAPIAETELVPGDFIVKMNGMEISDYDSLNEALKGVNANDTVKATCAHLNNDGTVRYYDIAFTVLADTSGNY